MAAVKIRNQCQRVIGYHLGPSFDKASNGEQWLLDSLGEISVFVDAGANVGDWTADVLERSPEAHGVLIEPGAEAVRRLRTRFNGHVRTVEAAVGEREGGVTFYEQPNASELSSAYCTNGVAREVPVITIDSLGFERIDLLKLDVEGGEAAAIRGAERMFRERRIATVQFEYNDSWLAAGETLTAVVRLLDEWGYETFLLRPDRLEPLDGRWGEFFAYSNFVGRPR